mmetsp:Transcript_70242/g.86184  ORF Transcript_70242/g.86184 Transcript_70242/m.86184 type:complete len:248 (+) Transcript_70242:116-859(+)
MNTSFIALIFIILCLIREFIVWYNNVLQIVTDVDFSWINADSNDDGYLKYNISNIINAIKKGVNINDINPIGYIEIPHDIHNLYRRRLTPKCEPYNTVQLEPDNCPDPIKSRLVSEPRQINYEKLVRGQSIEAGALIRIHAPVPILYIEPTATTEAKIEIYFNMDQNLNKPLDMESCKKREWRKMSFTHDYFTLKRTVHIRNQYDIQDKNKGKYVHYLYTETEIVIWTEGYIQRESGLTLHRLIKEP